MLDSRTLRAAAAALRPGGTLTIVTDAPTYAAHLLEALDETGLFEGAAKGGGVDAPPGAAVLQVAGGGSAIELISARPGAWCRHAAGASSYFDRLWQTGVSRHSAAAAERYVLHCVRRREGGREAEG